MPGVSTYVTMQNSPHSQVAAIGTAIVSVATLLVLIIAIVRDRRRSGD